MIREEIDNTPGFRELTSASDLPANINAETTILGAIMLDNAAHAEAAAALKPNDFSLESHRRIFLRMSELIDAKRAVDIVTLSDPVDGAWVKEIGGVAYLASLTEGLPRQPVIGEYIRIVQEKSKLRRIMGSCAAAIAKCQDQTETAENIVAELGINLKGICGKATK